MQPQEGGCDVWNTCVSFKKVDAISKGKVGVALGRSVQKSGHSFRKVLLELRVQPLLKVDGTFGRWSNLG